MLASVPDRILLVRTGAMGDILHALPAVAALRAARPSLHIGWAVEPHWRSLLAATPGSHRGPEMPLVDRVHDVPTRAWKRRPLSLATLREMLQLRHELRTAGYNAAIDLQGSIRSAVIAKFAGAPVAGAAAPRERHARRFYNQAFDLHQASVIAQASELLRSVFSGPQRLLPPQLPVDPAAEAWCDAQALPPGFVLLHPTAGWAAKQWPVSRYAELTRLCLHAGACVVVSTGADAHAPAEITAAGAQPACCGVAQLIALTRRAALVVGGDSGPVHLAAALLRPTVALFGPTDPARTGPLFPQARLAILRGANGAYTLKRGSDPHPGLGSITAQAVLAAASPWFPAGAIA